MQSALLYDSKMIISILVTIHAKQCMMAVRSQSIQHWRPKVQLVVG